MYDHFFNDIFKGVIVFAHKKYLRTVNLLHICVFSVNLSKKFEKKNSGPLMG